jgi:Predicted transcriptional regulator
MGTAYFIEKLKQGESVLMRVSGNSMTGKINHGATVLVEPVREDDEIKIGDILLCRVRGYMYLHMVTAIKNGEEFQISNIHGHVNGWTNRPKIFGRFIKVVED